MRAICDRELKIATAESCTGGMFAALMTDIEGCGHGFDRGFVTYSKQAKTALVGVPGELILAHGAVSEPVARAMAEGALARSNAQLAVSITGIAGPGGGTEDKPVGYVCWCAKLADGSKLVRDVRLPGDRAEIRDRSTTVAMHLLRRHLRGEEAPV